MSNLGYDPDEYDDETGDDMDDGLEDDFDDDAGGIERRGLTPETLDAIMAGHHSMVVALGAGVHQGLDPELLFRDHDLLHAFAEEIYGMDASPAMALNERERRQVAGAVLDEMAEVLGAYVDGRIGLRDVGGPMTDLFRELAPCIPEALDNYRLRMQTVERWLVANPEVIAVMDDETNTSTLTPFELLEALAVWMQDLDDDERDEFHERFADNPAGVVREALQRAALRRELESGIPEE